jgi:hypothetical protein
MKKILSVLLIVCLVGIGSIGCKSFGVFTKTGAETAITIVSDATKVLNVVGAIIPVLTTLVGLPDFVTKVTPYLSLAKVLETNLKNFINAHKDDTTVTDTTKVALDTLKDQVNQLVTDVAGFQTAAVKRLSKDNMAMKTEVSKMRALMKDK